MVFAIKCPKCGSECLIVIKKGKFLQCTKCHEIWSTNTRASIPKLGQKVAIKK